MSVDEILKPLTKDDLKKLGRAELEALFLGEQSLRLQGEVERREIEEKYVLIKSKIFGRSSEKSTDSPKSKTRDGEKKKRSSFQKNLRERYPNVDIKEEEILLEVPPSCPCCQANMEDSGMVEESEYLTVIPKKYLIVVQKRHKYRCSKCHGALETAPSLPRILPGSSYSNELILDVALSKFCDLIPVERYAMMAARQGLKGLPPNSLINLIHELAEFCRFMYESIKIEVKNVRWLQADETPHRMLEGHDKSHWYHWGFTSQRACYFEIHETRSGDVASEFLKDAKCEVLVSDIYSGYSKALSIVNDLREKSGEKRLIASYCNAHARRKFDEARDPYFKQASFYLECYRQIYELNADSKDKSPEDIIRIRVQMRPLFEQMKGQGKKDLEGVSNKSSLARAINYFINNFDGLTYFIQDAEIPIDNNTQERLLRNPVIGRKTWFGTHSIKGAMTTAIMFSIIETCKLNKVNPREYFKELVKSRLGNKEVLTPWEYAAIKNSS